MWESTLCLKGNSEGGKKLVSEKVTKFGLKIKHDDWCYPKKRFGFINFLDISFSFDAKKQLQTDLFRKPTDSRSYLSFSSCHPNYMFSGIVKSQATRLRRIINDESRLAMRLDELQRDFQRCGYPEKMLNNIFDQTKQTKRSLKRREQTQVEDDDSVMVISTFGADRKITEITKNIEKHSEEIKFRYVKKTGPSLRNMLVKSKVSAFGNPHGETIPCGAGQCKASDMLSKKDFVTDSRGKKFKTAKGKCNSRNLIYHARCKHCDKVYVGKTTQALHSRISGHRGKFVECLFNNGHQPNDDDHLLGLHLYHKHKLRHRLDFDESYEFTILENCNPRDLDVKEHVWVQRLRTVAPYGLNSHDPFGIPILL